MPKLQLLVMHLWMLIPGGGGLSTGIYLTLQKNNVSNAQRQGIRVASVCQLDLKLAIFRLLIIK